MLRYTYRGDKLTDPGLRGMQCDPVHGNMLVIDAQGRRHVVPGRQLKQGFIKWADAEQVNTIVIAIDSRLGDLLMEEVNGD